VLVLTTILILGSCFLLAGEPGNEEIESERDTAQEELALAPNIIIRNNTIGDSGFGVYIGERGGRKDSVLIVDNIIIDNGEGIRVLGTEGKNLVLNNTITNNIVGVRIADVHQGRFIPGMAVSLISIHSNTIADNKEHNLLNVTSGILDIADNQWETAHHVQQENETTSAPDDSATSLALPIPLFISTLTFDPSCPLTMTTTIAMIVDRALMGVTFLYPTVISLPGLSFVPYWAQRCE
jgi:parallel beta-helix repeat protein